MTIPVALAVALVVIGVVASIPLLVVMAPTMAVIRVSVRRRTARQILDRTNADDVIDQVDTIIQHLKGGQSLRTAVASTYPAVSSAMSAGATMDEAVDKLRIDAHPQLEIVVATVKLLVLRGGSAMGSMERLSDTVRSARRIDMEVATQATQATTSAAALGALPTIFGVFLAALNRRIALFYLFDPLGVVCAWLAVVSSFAGWLWMQRLIARASTSLNQ